MDKIILTIARLGTAWLAALLMCTVAHAQTSAQLEQLNKLSPEQRAAVISKLQESDVVAPQSVPQEQRVMNPRRGAQPLNNTSLLSIDAATQNEEETEELIDLVMQEEQDNYVIEPGDTIKLQLFGSENASYNLVVTRGGILDLPELGPIAVSGLQFNELKEMLQQRFNEHGKFQEKIIEPLIQRSAIQVQETLPEDLAILSDVRVSITMSKKSELKPFGYDLFTGEPTTFAATDIPVPVDYVIGPGDTIELQLFGSENAFYSLVVTREGILNLPELGPISVSGLQFGELKETLQQRVSEQMIGVRASITMGRLRSIRIFILGDAYRPGTYTISSLSTMTNALLVSGGISPIGSLRNVQLKRHGKLIQTLDLYDLLLRGDTSEDTWLQPGDVIFIPPVGRVVGIDGKVRRPAIYELKAEHTVNDALELAGGLLPTAYPQISQIARINDKHERTVIDVDLTTSEGLGSKLSADDTIHIYSILEKREDIVLLSGHVHRSRSFQWHAGMRLTDLITSQQALLPKADLNYVLIRREIPPNRHIEVISTDLGIALAEPESNADILLEPKDRVIVFSQNQDRVSAMSSLVNELRQQGSFYEPDKVVGIYGHIRFPGEYPLNRGMRARDLFRVAGLLLPDANLEYGILVREKNYGGDIEVLQLNPTDLLQTVGTNNIELNSRDQLWFFRNGEDKDVSINGVLQRLLDQATNNKEANLVSIDGSVKDPGQYPLTRDMNIRDLILAAGGLEESAYIDEAELTRYKLLNNGLRNTLLINLDLNSIIAGNSQDNLKLQPYDTLTIKQVPMWRTQGIVDIEGEVRFPGRYTIQLGERLSSLVQRAGGLNDLAFPRGAVFLREELRVREQQQLEEMAERLESEAAMVELSGQEESQSTVAREELLNQIDETVAAGRLAINLPLILNGTTVNNSMDILLEDGDRLLIPQQSLTVTIIGEVQYPTSHVFESDVSRNQYIQLSGGLTQSADKKRIYVVRADGNVEIKTNIFRKGAIKGIHPGDTIVVPLKTDRMNQLTLWTNVTTMIYNIGVATAAVASF